MTKKETLAQVFSCELCEISKKSFSYRTPPMAASGDNFYQFQVIFTKLRFSENFKFLLYLKALEDFHEITLRVLFLKI